MHYNKVDVKGGMFLSESTLTIFFVIFRRRKYIFE